MGNTSFTKDIAIETSSDNFQVSYVSTPWAKGFSCEPGKCGLCCITQVPDTAPKTKNSNFNRGLCAWVDLKNKTCKKYDMRPTSCRVYPFLLGYELGKFIISPSLECPGCISEPEIDEKIIHNIFENYNFIGTVNTLRRIYKIIMLDSNQEQHINLKWNDFKKDIQNFFNQKISFPFLTNFFSSIYGERLEIPAIGAFKMTEGFYIATKFTSHHIYCAKTKGNKISIRRFDDINEIEHIELKPKYLDIGMDDGATNLFRDYISLLCSRPFLSLASVLKFNQHDNKNAFQHLQGCFNGSLRTVEAGAALIAQRDNLTIIDRNSMREIISYAEGNTHSLFINPSNIRL